MQLGVDRTLFPRWSSAAVLVREHSGAAARFAAAAMHAGPAAQRLDAAVRAMTSFDHAIDNANRLPLSWLMPGATRLYRGYDAAKLAVSLLVGSGLIPGARERVGRQQLAAARDAFDAGVDTARGDRSRFGRHLASGWLDATAEDALTGTLLLRPGSKVAIELLGGINQLRTNVARRGELDEALVNRLGKLFSSAGTELDGIVDEAERGAGDAGPDAGNDVIERCALLLRDSAHDAAALGSSVIEHEQETA